MIAIIRIKGRIDIPKDIDETLNRLRLKRKHACVVLKESREVEGMIKKIRNFVAYGKIDRETFIELINKRGTAIANKKIDAEKIAEEFSNEKIKKRFIELGIKPFFRLHPPRGGIESKKHYPRGVLGDNKEKINELIRRML